MATGTMTGTHNLATPQSIGITLDSDSYPNGSISWDSGTFYCTKGLSNNVTYYFNLYLCDSSGGNKALINEIGITGNASGYGTSTVRSGSVSGASGLVGKSLYIVAEFSRMSTSGSYSYGATYFELRASNSGTTFTVSTGGAYSPSSCSADNVYFGDNSTVRLTINSETNNVYHVVTWSLGNSYSVTVTTSNGGRSATTQIPTTWMNAISSSTTATINVSVETRKANGGLIGTTSTTFTATIKDDVKPVINSISVVISNQHASGSFASQYVQSLTGATITVNATAPTGTTISAYYLTISPSETATHPSVGSNIFTVSSFINSGTITFYVSVRDNRGRSATGSTNISVLAYRQPRFSVTSAFRCDANGVADENGTNAMIREVVEYTQTSGNSVTVNSTYFIVSGQETTAVNGMVSGTSYKVGNNSLSPNNTYYIRFTATDTIGGSVTTTTIVQTAAYAIHVQNGGSGVAFGKVSTQGNAVEINEGWNLYYKGYITLPVVYADSEAARQAIQNPPAGLVCLVKKT